jgi:hypothetical protein
MHQKEGGCQLTLITDGDGVHHTGGMRDGIKPESTRHLPLGEVRTSHVNLDFPVRLHKTIRRLALCGSYDDLGIIIDEVLTDCGAK